jgi:hypothetical protein
MFFFTGLQWNFAKKTQNSVKKGIKTKPCPWILDSPPHLSWEQLRSSTWYMLLTLLLLQSCVRGTPHLPSHYNQRNLPGFYSCRQELFQHFCIRIFKTSERTHLIRASTYSAPWSLHSMEELPLSLRLRADKNELRFETVRS